MRDRGCLLGLALCCASAALVVGVLMFAPRAALAVAFQTALLVGVVVLIVAMLRSEVGLFQPTATVQRLRRPKAAEVAPAEEPDPAEMGWKKCRHGAWMPPGVPCVTPPDEEMRGFVELGWPEPQDSPDSVPPGVEALRARGYERINRARPEKKP